MKSLSLDSPESSELQTSRTRRCLPSTSGYIGYGGSGGNSEHVTPPSNNSRLHCKSIYCWLIALIIVFTPIKYANIFTLYFPLIFLNLVPWYLCVCACVQPHRAHQINANCFMLRELIKRDLLTYPTMSRKAIHRRVHRHVHHPYAFRWGWKVLLCELIGCINN